MRHINRGSPGFTLMEMMIALFVSAVIVAPFYFVSSGLSQRSAKQQLETEAMQRVRWGLNTLAHDLSRVGLLVSPNPADDSQSLSKPSLIPNSSASFRRAVVHLNPNDASMNMDSIGNLLVSADMAGFSVAQWVASMSDISCA